MQQQMDCLRHLSYEMLTEQLRNKLQFEGIIITDALDMGAVIKYNQQDTSLIAIKAGGRYGINAI